VEEQIIRDRRIRKGDERFGEINNNKQEDNWVAEGE
jgi:hypothetical protein